MYKSYNDIPRIVFVTRQEVDWYDLEGYITKQKRYQKEFGSKFELNPDFQRGHVWQTKYQIDYVEYILTGGISGRDLFFNHPGWQDDWCGDMVCLDGLQRLTAVRLFMSNQIPAFGKLYKDYEEKRPPGILYFNILNLQTRKQILKFYLSFNFKGISHKATEKVSLLKMIENTLD